MLDMNDFVWFLWFMVGLSMSFSWVFPCFFQVLPFTSRCWKWPSHPGESEHHQVLLRQHLGLWCGAQGPKQEPSRRQWGRDHRGDKIYAVHQYCVYVLCLHNCVILYIYILFIYMFLYFYMCGFMCLLYISTCASACMCTFVLAYHILDVFTSLRISLHRTSLIFLFYVDVLHTCYIQDNTLAKPTSIWLDACIYVFVKLIANSCCLLSCSS